jgi:uncharacterized protein (TIGR02266 family)
VSTASTRHQKRAPVTLKIKFKSSTLEQFVERYSVDISQGGIFIRTKSPLEVGTPLRFEFQLKDASPLITGEGTVVWTREHDPQRSGLAPGMGVRFDRLPSESQQILNRILEQKKSRPAAGAAAARAEEEFVDSPTKVAPRAMIEGLAEGSRDGAFGIDDSVEPDAFEEATKVGMLDDLVARTAQRGGDEDEPILTSAAREPSREGPIGLARTVRRDPVPATDAEPAPEPPNSFDDDLPVLVPKKKGEFLSQIATELNMSPPPPSAGVSESAPTALAMKPPSSDDVGRAVASAPRPAAASTPLSASAAADVTQSVQPARPKSRSGVPWVAIAALFLVAAAAGGWWVWNQQEAEQAATSRPAPRSAPAAAPEPAPEPEPEGHEVTVTSDTPGAVAALIDGDQKGATPLTFENLEEGKTYEVAISAPGFIEKRIEITGGAEEAPAVKLEAKPRVIAVKSEPAGAAVYINNQRKGKTPVEVELSGKLADADRYTVLLRRSGFDPEEKVIAADGAWAEEESRMVAALDVELTRKRARRPPPDTSAGGNPASGGDASGGDASGGQDPASGGGSTGGDSGGDTSGSGETPPKKPPEDTGASPTPDWAKKEKATEKTKPAPAPTP